MDLNKVQLIGRAEIIQELQECGKDLLFGICLMEYRDIRIMEYRKKTKE